MQTLDFELDRDFVELNQLLKLAGLCDSGGAGKQLVASGMVFVDGRREERKTAKSKPTRAELAQLFTSRNLWAVYLGQYCITALTYFFIYVVRQVGGGERGVWGVGRLAQVRPDLASSFQQGGQGML